ncbi:MAG TPA: hypothetical protein VGN51_08185, partial [Acidimicrobiia bacterium]
VTPRGDDVHEMPRRRPIDDQAVESILGGTTTGDDLDGLAAFVVDVRETAAGPMPAPSPALVHVLTQGFSTDQGDLPATAASNADGPALQAAGLPKWRSAQMKVSRYVAGLSIAAKIALGAGCVFAATATAGATGVLPGPVQEAMDAVTPFGGGDGAPGALPPSATAGTGDVTTPAGGTVTTVPGGDTPGTGIEPTHDAPPPSTTPTPTPTTAPPVAAPVPGGGDSPGATPPLETPVAQSLAIHCSLNDGHTAVTCEWTTAPPEGFGTYVLLRTSDDGKAGRVLVQSGDITTHTWTDSLVLAPGVTYSYMVDTIAPDGSTTGHSNRVTVTF